MLPSFQENQSRYITPSPQGEGLSSEIVQREGQWRKSIVSHKQSQSSINDWMQITLEIKNKQDAKAHPRIKNEIDSNFVFPTGDLMPVDTRYRQNDVIEVINGMGATIGVNERYNTFIRARRKLSPWASIPSKKTAKLTTSTMLESDFEKISIGDILRDQLSGNSYVVRSAVSDIVSSFFQTIAIEAYNDSETSVIVGSFAKGFEDFVSLGLQARIQIDDKLRTPFLESLMDDIFNAFEKFGEIQGTFWCLTRSGDEVVLMLTRDMKEYFLESA